MEWIKKKYFNKEVLLFIRLILIIMVILKFKDL
jgi:hypothetical protein